MKTVSNRSLKNAIFGFGFLDNTAYFISLVVVVLQGKYYSPAQIGGVYLASLAGYLVSSFFSQPIYISVLRSKGVRETGFPWRRNLIFCLLLTIAYFVIGVGVLGLNTGAVNWIYLVVLFVFVIFEINNQILEAANQKYGAFRLVGLTRITGNLVGLIFILVVSPLYPEMVVLCFWLVVVSATKLLIFKFHLEKSTDLMSFDRFIKLVPSYGVYSGINFISRNIDQYLLSLMVGVAELGFYNRTLQFVQMPVKVLNGIISGVLIPHRISNEGKSEDFYRPLFYILIYSLLSMAGIKYMLIPLLDFFWDESWSVVFKGLYIVSPVVSVQCFMAYYVSYLVTLEKDRWLVPVGLVHTFCALPVPFVSYWLGFEIGLVTYVFMYSILGYSAVLWMFNRSLRVSLATDLKLLLCSIPIVAIFEAFYAYFGSSSLSSELVFWAIILSIVFVFYRRLLNSTF